MNIDQATEHYEEWLSERLVIVKADLNKKHLDMASDPFVFLRATFYRWAQTFIKKCPEVNSAPVVLAVGDLHIENFGTWRDAEGRLVWGINDFDESYPLPYTNDLVRLATSVNLAIAANELAVNLTEACTAILRGYTQSIGTGGRPYVLDEEHPDVRALVTARLADPVRFWKKLDAQKTVKGPIPDSAAEALLSGMPAPGLKFRVAHRQAGEGSLGRQRFVALARYEGGRIAREAKSLAPSACVWALKGDGPKEILYQVLLSRSVRCRDPFVALRGQWIVRRLAPDCSRIELSSLPKARNEVFMLEAMGRETANVHLGTQDAAKAIQHDLKKRTKNWLRDAASVMTDATHADWQAWKTNLPSAKAKPSS